MLRLQNAKFDIACIKDIDYESSQKGLKTKQRCIWEKTNMDSEDSEEELGQEMQSQ